MAVSAPGSTFTLRLFFFCPPFGRVSPAVRLFSYLLFFFRDCLQAIFVLIMSRRPSPRPCGTTAFGRNGPQGDRSDLVLLDLDRFSVGHVQDRLAQHGRDAILADPFLAVRLGAPSSRRQDHTLLVDQKLHGASLVVVLDEFSRVDPDVSSSLHTL